MRSSRIAFAASLLSLAAAGPALAQTALAQNAPAPDLVARAAVVDLDEVVISALRTAASRLRTGVAVTALSSDALEADARTGLAEILAQQPGVALLQSGPFGNSGNLLIRGVGAGYVSIRVDGIRVDDPSTIQGGLDIGSLLASDVGRVEILRGSQSALWGGSAVGGVVSITSRRPEAEGTEQRIEIEAGSRATTRLAYGLTQKTGALELALAATHYRSDGFSTARLGTEADGAEARRLSFSARYQLNETAAVGANFFVQHTAQDYDDAYSFPAFRLIDSDASQTRLERGARVFAELDTGNTAHLFEVTHYDIARKFNDSYGSTPFDGKRLTASWQATRELSEDLTLVYGLDWMEERALYPNLAGGEASRRVAGAFASGIWSASEALDLSAALRLDEDSGFGTYATGRLAAAWHLSEATTLRAAFATGYRAPTLDQRFADYIDPVYADYLGNPDLEPEESRSFEIGLEHAFAGGATVSASLFRLEIENYVKAMPIIPGDLWGDHRNQNVAGKTVFQGVEMAAHLPLGEAASLGFGYTLTDSDDVVGVPRHRLTASLDGTLYGKVTGGLRLTHVEDVLGRTRPLEDYTVLDAQLGYALSDKTELYLRIENLTGTSYEVVEDFGTPDRAAFLGLRARF